MGVTGRPFETTHVLVVLGMTGLKGFFKGQVIPRTSRTWVASNGLPVTRI